MTANRTRPLTDGEYLESLRDRREIWILHGGRYANPGATFEAILVSGLWRPFRRALAPRTRL